MRTIQPFGEYPGGGRFPDATWTREQIGVTDAFHLDRVLKRLNNGFLADYVLEDLGPELSSNDLIFHESCEPTEDSRQAKGATVSHWLTRYRCFLPDLAGFSSSNCTAPQSLCS